MLVLPTLSSAMAQDSDRSEEYVEAAVSDADSVSLVPFTLL